MAAAAAKVELYSIEYIRYARAVQRDHKIEWEYSLQWYGFPRDDKRKHWPQHSVADYEVLKQFFQHIESSTLREDGMYSHGERLWSNQSLIDYRIMEARIVAMEEIEDKLDQIPDASHPEAQMLHEQALAHAPDIVMRQLEERPDFSQRGNFESEFSDWTFNSHSRLIAKGAAPFPTDSLEVPMHEIEENLRYLEGERDFDGIPIVQYGDGGHEDVVPIVIQDDGFLSRLQRVPFTDSEPPHKVLLRLFPRDVLHKGRRNWRHERRECNVCTFQVEDMVVLIDCLHLFCKPCIQGWWHGKEDITCPKCQKAPIWAPFPATYLADPCRINRPVINRPDEDVLEGYTAPVAAASTATTWAERETYHAQTLQVRPGKRKRGGKEAKRRKAARELQGDGEEA
ncbi:hypothetical protein EXIGLDRAFT_768293 [Exidia glandulosa HHB12029]|uniref:RING-type domain-containing protein n=1 Tax=Exidia glandulosa HHB12029 TaxID=1314781 RepID=A0A165IBL9_EXIGL|nr:hypothetical protein EXIGLDRAFT_768293 [Exidia glandulosa HHB12029]